MEKGEGNGAVDGADAGVGVEEQDVGDIKIKAVDK